jgi:hypothetical protein
MKLATLILLAASLFLGASARLNRLKTVTLGE